MLGSSKRRNPKNRTRTRRLDFETMESLLLLSGGASVLSYHNDPAGSGQNPAETVLTRTNVNPTSFGKLGSDAVDGQVYAQPLVIPGVKVTAPGHAGVHDVLLVATEHDTVYAFDATTPGVPLWTHSLLDTGLPGASVTPVPNPETELSSPDITIEVGITGTPVVDNATMTVYVIAKTKEVVNNEAHYVQRLHALSLADGSDKVSPFVIGDTTGTNVNRTPIQVFGSGTDSGAVTDPNGSGQSVVQFNALREHQRGALLIVNNTVIVTWAGHSDAKPYHGWVVAFDTATLAIRGVFCTTPNGWGGGVWEAGGAPVWDGSALYFSAGNGTFDGSNGAGINQTTAPAPGPVTGINAQGFPEKHDYADTVVKLVFDPSTTASAQGPNGFGLKLVDYFAPYNQARLLNYDLDLGSESPVLLPDAAGSTAHPHLLLAKGKEGVLYLLNRDNLGKYGTTDFPAVLQESCAVVKGDNDNPGTIANSVYAGGRLYVAQGGVNTC